MRTAAAKLAGSARPVPAMSNAVPWSGLVRTNGRPSVTLTPCSTPRYFTGIRPWSWVIATTTSNSPGWPAALRARMNTVSGANGPLASMPSARAACTAGAMTRSSSSPNRPPSPACGLRPATAMRGRAGAEARAPPRAAMRIVSSTASKVTASIAWRSDMWIVTSTVRSSSLASIMRTGGSAPPGGGERLQHLGVAGIADAGGGERFLVDRRRDERRGLAALRPGRPPARCSAPPRRRRARRRGRAARRSGRAAGRRPAAPGCSPAAAPPRRRARRSAPPAAGRRSSAAARRITATSPTTNAAAGVGRAEPGGDDLRADAAGVAHRQRERPARR